MLPHHFRMVKVILTILAIIATKASFAQTVVKFTNQVHASFAFKFMFINHHPLPFLLVSLIHNLNEPLGTTCARIFRKL
jgi:hypothetical protein